MADGRGVYPVCHTDKRYTFRLPSQFAELRLVSRSGAPAELGLARDPRQLGVGVRRLVLASGPCTRILDAEDGWLGIGFHDYESGPDLRWTDGNALLPVAWFAGIDGGATLTVHCAGSARYVDDGGRTSDALPSSWPPGTFGVAVPGLSRMLGGASG